MLVMSICLLINGTFWAIIVTEKLHIPTQNLAVFPFVKSVIMLVFFFVVIPRMRRLPFKIPLVLGFAGFVLSQLLLITIPEQGYALLMVSILLEACSTAVVSPLVDQMTVRTVDPKERARIQSILYVGIILLSSPFGWIGGMLSQANKNFPFILNIGLFVVGGVLAYLAGEASRKRELAAALETEAVLP
jgi:predicted MFS family arabinose efflux permease